MESPNLIHVYKFTELNSNQTFVGYNDPHVQHFAIFDERIGHISCLKWRADFSNSVDERFIGYLLATSSNGNGYIFRIPGETETSSDPKTFKVYTTDKKIMLSVAFPFGQCTSGDWCQFGGATNIALGICVKVTI
jgi:hypothetical protein